METFQQNGAGVVFKATCEEDGVAIDVSSATVKQIVFTNPSNVDVIKTAVTGSSTGQIQYTSVSGDFDTVGMWKWQPYVYFSDSEFWHGDHAIFKVKSN